LRICVSPWSAAMVCAAARLRVRHTFSNARFRLVLPKVVY
jgi:hypothetical protein